MKSKIILVMLPVLLFNCIGLYKTAKITPVKSSNHTLSAVFLNENIPFEDGVVSAAYKFRTGIIEDRLELGLGLDLLWPGVTCGGKLKVLPHTALDFNLKYFMPGDGDIFPNKATGGYDISLIVGENALYGGASVIWSEQSDNEGILFMPFIGYKHKLSEKWSVIPEFSLLQSKYEKDSQSLESISGLLSFYLGVGLNYGF